MRALLVTVLVSAPACFGDGPTPTKPSEATILVQLTPPSGGTCQPTQYIGPLAFGDPNGFAGLLTYQPQANCDNGGGGNTSTAVPIIQFSMAGDAPYTPLAGASAGMSDGTYSPRLLERPNGSVMWLSTPGNTGPSSHLDVGSFPLSVSLNVPPKNVFLAPIALLGDGQSFYIAGEAGGGGGGTGGKAEPNNPNYPCCGPASTSENPGLLSRIDASNPTMTADMPVSPLFDSSHSARTLTQNTDSLLYLVRSQAMTGGWRIARFPKAGTLASDEQTIVMLSNINDSVPVSFHATDANVVWLMSPSYDQTNDAHPRCELGRHDLTTGVDNPAMFVTEAFNCTGVTADDVAAYFAIVEIGEGQHMHGIGIGRVDLATKQFESIRLGVSGVTGGARRVYNLGDDIIVADPSAVARIAKTAFEGRVEIGM